jgi:hypothetical protein
VPLCLVDTVVGVADNVVRDCGKFENHGAQPNEQPKLKRSNS